MYGVCLKKVVNLQVEVKEKATKLHIIYTMFPPYMFQVGADINYYM